MIGRIHSFETFGTVDVPGIRFVIFMQGCPLRCAYCHNPDTWAYQGGKEQTVDEVVSEIIKYQAYFSGNGGVTVSGGEPLVQIDFVIALFKQLKKLGIHTCVDTSGVLFNKNHPDTLAKYDELLKVTDLFLLDIKQIDEKAHRVLTKMSNQRPLAFARYLSDHHHPMWVRYVLVPGVTDDIEQLKQLKSFIDTLSNVEKVEVLPYHVMGISKYEQLGIEYPLKGIDPPTKESILKAKQLLGV